MRVVDDDRVGLPHVDALEAAGHRPGGGDSIGRLLLGRAEREPELGSEHRVGDVEAATERHVQLDAAPHGNGR